MRRIFFLFIIITFSGVGLSQSMLLECGQNSPNNFDGWRIDSYDLFSEVHFESDGISFYSTHGGNIPVSVVKHIDNMVNFEHLNIQFDFNAIKDCTIDNVTYYLSEDGENWTAIQNSHNRVTSSFVNDAYIFVKAIANVNFSSNSQLKLTHAKIQEGDEHILTLPEHKKETPANSFHIFSFKHTINIETQLEQPFEVMVTALSGKIIHREIFTGSSRFNLPQHLSGLFIVSIIQDNAFQASKKIAIQ